MQQYDNPFNMRASEKMTSDDVFISLLSDDTLYPLKDYSDRGALWNNLTYICSAPGGGKTTMLRCFSPSVLYKVSNNRKENDKLYKALKSMCVVSGNKILKCGAYLLTNRSYVDLEDEDVFTKPQARRLLFALLNARFTLVAIKALQELKTLQDSKSFEYDQLDDITFTPSLDFSNRFAPNPVPHTAKELFDWAAGIERKITGIIETYDTIDESNGHDSLFILKELHASNFTIHGKPIVDDFIFQLDDCHKLSKTQLDFLRQELVETRITNTVWLAMRYDKFTYEELMPKTDMIGRDYNSIHLGTDNKFEKMLGSIMDKRSNLSRHDIKLANSLEQTSILSDSDYEAIVDFGRKNINTVSQILYNELLNYIDENVETLQDKAEQTFALMLFAQRESKTGFPIFPHERNSYDENVKADLVKIAQQIIPAVFNRPMYYGTERLKDLSPNNTEQFIGFCNVLYEQLLTQKLLHPRKALMLNAASQDKLIKEECKNKMKRIFNEHGKSVYTFLNNLGGFCRSQTLQIGSSYGAVTGFAVRDAETLFGSTFDTMDDSKLGYVLKVCLANNFLFTRETKQGEKDKEWIVFYLNRWICGAFSLPLSYGGWRKRTFNELEDWIKKDEKWEIGIRM